MNLWDNPSHNALWQGHGHTVNYLDKTRVSKYIAIEPNVLMHNEITMKANARGYTEEDGTLLILPCGAEDVATILTALDEPNSVDTLISVLTLCTIPSPEEALTALVEDILKPNGTFLFYEHVLSPRADVAWWQRFWTPIWVYAMDGCRLDRPTHLWIERMGVWKESAVWGQQGDVEENLFWHQLGKFVKA